MADPISALQEEQLRLQPMLDRLLGLAALWADPPAPPRGQGEKSPHPPGSSRFNESGDPALAFVANTGAASAGPEALPGSAVSQPALPGLPQLMPWIRALPAPTGATPDDTRAATDSLSVASARLLRRGQLPSAPSNQAASGPFDAAVRMAPASQPSPPTATTDRGPAQPQLPDGAGPPAAPGRDPAMMASRGPMPDSSEPGELARLGMLLAATAAAGAPMGTAPTRAAPATSRYPGIMTNPASSPARSDAAFPWPVATSRGAALEPAPSVVGGDSLEDRLADILERAAAEAGVLLP
jgi:hypothetical protein